MISKNTLSQDCTFDFYMVYQPKFRDASIVGFEALCRLNIPNVSISDYLLNLEDTCLFDLSVMEKVIFDVAKVKMKSVSINIHPSSILDMRFMSYCKAIGDYLNFSLTFELIESEDYEITSKFLNKISQLKALGFKFSLDDFGKDFSNDNALVNLPITEVKIDASLIRDIEKNFLKFKFLKFLNEMINNLIGGEVVFEGVENKRQLELIRLINPSAIIQGYYLSRPIELDYVSDFLDLNNSFASKMNVCYASKAKSNVERDIFEYIRDNIDLSSTIYDRSVNCFVGKVDKFKTIYSEDIVSTLYNYSNTYLKDGCYVRNTFTNMLDNCEHLYIVRNSKGVVVYDNAGHQKLLGKSLVGMSPVELISFNSEYEHCLAKDRALLSSNKSFLVEDEEFEGIVYETIREKITFNDEIFVLCSIYSKP